MNFIEYKCLFLLLRKKITQDYQDYYEEEEEEEDGEEEKAKDSVKVCNGFFGKWHQKLLQDNDDDDS